MILINVYHGGQVLKCSTGLDYSLSAKFSFSTTDETSFEEVKRQIYVGLGLFPSQYKLNISARLNTATNGSFFYNLFCVDNEAIWKVIIQNATPMINFRMLEVIVESITNTDIENDSSMPGSSHMPYVEPNCPPNYYSTPNVRDDSDNDSDNGTDSNDDINDSSGSDNNDDSIDMDDIETQIDVQEILKQWQQTIPFINRGMQHPCDQFNDGEPMPYADESFFMDGRRFDDPLAEGQTFDSKEHLKKEISDVHMKLNIELLIQNSNKKVFITKCTNTPCPWRLYAKECDSGAWIIATNPYEHSCYGSATRSTHRQLTARIVAGVIREHIKKNLEMEIREVYALVRTAYPTVEPTYNKIWRGRELAIADLFGSWEKSYEMMTPLLSAIQATNPGTKFLLESDFTEHVSLRIFRRVAWAFGPCIQAWPYLRPVISIDAGHLSGRYKGKLFMACAYDAEQQLLPLAFCIAEEETVENWGWFLNWMRKEIFGPGCICVISDRAAGIKSVFDQPNLGWCERNGEAVHRLCAQHVAQNIYKQCRDKKLKGTFKWTVRRKKPWRFFEGMQRIRRKNASIHDYIMKIGTDPTKENDPLVLHKWTQCEDGGLNRWGIMTTNGSESLNNVFRIARQLPVCAIVEKTFYKCVEWFVARRTIAAEWEANGLLFSKKVTEMLKKRGNKGRTHEVTPIVWQGHFENQYDVLVKNGVIARGQWGEVKYVVTFPPGEIPTCICRKPQLTGIPCNHVLAVLSFRNVDPTNYTSQYYSIQNYINTWSGLFNSYGDRRDWPLYHGPLIRPDPTKINKGRRKHKRIPMVMDEMEGRIRSSQARQSDAAQTEQPARHSVSGSSSARQQPGRNSVSAPTDARRQPARNSVSGSSSVEPPSTSNARNQPRKRTIVGRIRSLIRGSGSRA